MSTYILVHRDGTEEEKPFLIQDGHEFISEHISRYEWNRDKDEDCRVFAPLAELFEKVRFGIQKPIVINSGYRSVAKQERLYALDIAEHGGKPSGEVAKPGHSPHHMGAAMDLAIPCGWDADKLAPVIVHTAQGLGFDKARVGYVAYGKKFIHVDLVYMLYAPWIAGRKNPNPDIWAPGVKW